MTIDEALARFTFSDKTSYSDDSAPLPMAMHPHPKRNWWQKIVAWFKFYLVWTKFSEEALTERFK